MCSRKVLRAHLELRIFCVGSNPSLGGFRTGKKLTTLDIRKIHRVLMGDIIIGVLDFTMAARGSADVPALPPPPPPLPPPQPGRAISLGCRAFSHVSKAEARSAELIFRISEPRNVFEGEKVKKTRIHT